MKDTWLKTVILDFAHCRSYNGHGSTGAEPVSVWRLPQLQEAFKELYIRQNIPRIFMTSSDIKNKDAM
jgi:hypothetical protein